MIRVAAALAVLCAAAPALASTRYDPGLRFRSIATPHFVVHFHQGLDAAARRFAVLAEEVHEEMTRRMTHQVRGRTHVILVDQDDVPNGWATPLPYNLIEITVTEPRGASLIGNTPDWLRLVFTHEYAHVLHLDRSRGWARAARAVFGRAPFAFPNLTLPLWQIEGLATFEESQHGLGRLHAADFHAIVRQAAREGGFEPLDRVNGGLVDWPGGHGWYAYGGFFHAFLAERYGRERVEELSDRTAGRLPYLTAGAFRSVFGRPLGDLWEEYRDAEAAAARTGGWPAATRLTSAGHLARGPRFDRDGRIVYSRSDPHALPSLEAVLPDGSGARVLASRIGGDHVGITDEAIYFDQLELRQSVAVTSDLFRLDRASGAVERLTRGARLADPDASPDGRRLAAVALTAAGRDLVILPLESLIRLPPRPVEGLASCPAPAGDPCRVPPAGGGSASYASPRWSPDGRLVAVETRGGAGVSEIAVIDVTTGARTIVASGGRNVTPAWMPDGRAIVFASDRGGPFDLYRARLADGRAAVTGIERLTRLPGGAHSPDVAADGRSLVFVGYTPDGYDLFTMDLPGAGDGETAGPAPAVTPADAPDGHDAVGGDGGGARDVPEALPYSPLSTVGPRAWLPIVELDDDQLRIGAATGGVDALGYHAWAAASSWPVVRPGEFSALPARADARLSYAYDRWRPTLFAEVADETTWLLTAGPAGARQPLSLRDRSATVGAVLPIRRMRWSQTLLAAWRVEHRTVEAEGARATVTRDALRTAWGLSTAKRYGYSIGPEDGLSAGVSLELARRALGADVDGVFSRVDVRAYLPAAPRHGVLALRGSLAASRGDRAGRRILRVGGAGPDAGILGFDEDATSLLRGFAADAFQGDTAAVVNAEYRIPFAWPQRGVGTWPLFLRALHGALFADAGHAWTGRFGVSDAKTSWGGELSADVVAGYALPLTWTAGIAWGRDHAGGVPSGREVYVRVGHGF